MQISVITPVYNAAEFVTRSVESAVAQPETAEVLLIEDGSPDNSLEVCQRLAEKYDKVTLLRNPNGENRGAGASRNLGMKNAACEYIAFLDADDYYLPQRFTVPKVVFRDNPDCEGVYETIGNSVENDTGFERWTNANRVAAKLTGLTEPAAPELLAVNLIQGRFGTLHLDGIVIKKGVFQKSGLMSEVLRLHQDTDFIIRVAAVAKLLPGRLDIPVALRGIHDHNRLTAPRTKAQEYKNRMAFWLSLYQWTKENQIPQMTQEILQATIRYTRSHKYFKSFPVEFLPARLVWFVRLFRLVKYPEIILDWIKP